MSRSDVGILGFLPCCIIDQTQNIQQTPIAEMSLYDVAVLSLLRLPDRKHFCGGSSDDDVGVVS